MPEWALPQDIRFDQAAAQAAAEAVAELRFVLASAARSEDGAVDQALVGWEGLSADHFATSVRARQHEYRNLDLALRLLESALLDAVADALREQRRIDLLQAEWLVQDRAEQLEEQERDRYAAN